VRPSRRDAFGLDPLRKRQLRAPPRSLLARLQAELEPWQQEVTLDSIDVVDPLEWLGWVADNV
jgi:hypothetical protein